MLAVAMGLGATVMVALQPDSWFRRAADDWQRHHDYDAYLTRHVGNLIKRGRFRGLTPSGEWADCVYLGLSGILPRSKNSQYREWDYVCVASVDGRFLLASRAWNSWLWDALYEQEETGNYPMITYALDAYYAEVYRVDLCVPRDELGGDKQFTLSILKAKTSGEGELSPIDTELGWKNFEQHELVAEFTVPVPPEASSP